MKGFILSQTEWTVFPLITAVLFFAIFAGALFWIFRPGAKKVYNDRSLMVFDDGGER